MSTNSQAALWALVATALFSIALAMAKHASVELGYHALQILLFRQVVVLISALPAIVHTPRRAPRSAALGLHAIRLIGAFAALSIGVWAAALLPLVTVTTLFFTQVFFISLLGAWFLGERIGPHRVTAIAVGFAGVLIVMNPGAEMLSNPWALLPVLGALGAAVAVICVRKLSQTESTASLLTAQAIVIGLAAALPMPWVWKTPDIEGLTHLVAMGAIAAAAQWTGVRALRLGEASLLGNIEYVKLVYASAIGFFWFAEAPEPHAILGAAVIVASTAYLLHRERLQPANTQAMRPPTPKPS